MISAPERMSHDIDDGTEAAETFVIAVLLLFNKLIVLRPHFHGSRLRYIEDEFRTETQ